MSIQEILIWCSLLSLATYFQRRNGLLILLGMALAMWQTGAIVPLLTLGLVVISWLIIAEQAPRLQASLSLFGLGLGLIFYEDMMLSATGVAGLSLGCLLLLILHQGLGGEQARRRWALGAILGIIFLLAWLKFSPTANLLGDVAWVGVSYLALRLIATLLDFRRGLLPSAISLEEFLIYSLFPPALLAGPIDIAQRFIPEWRADFGLDSAQIIKAGKRLASGMFKKFVLADTLALITLNAQMAGDVDGIAAAWLVAYSYALQLFFDFSGYSDMAIGLGMLAGVQLPENFNRPYLQRNLALFWRNWHMSLTTWFRTYCFSPLSRTLIRRKLPISAYLLAQVSTMSLIAFWHGITPNFFIWGLWHALGLYAHKQLSDRTRRWYLRVSQTAWKRHIIHLGGMLTTFHFVVIGWVFFALPTPALSLEYLGKMFGL